MLLKKRKTSCLAVLIIITTITGSACKYDKEELLYPPSNQPVDCAAVPATFNAHILPLVLSKCSVPGCHDATAMGGLTFRNYNDINAVKNQINTQVVVQKTMPANGPLSPAEIDLVRCWLESGAPNN